MANQNLSAAKSAKNDEFYTQYPDIEKEINAYLEYDPDTFRGKVVYSNCDDPYESNFFRYFVLNFRRLGLKQYIATSYKPSPIANTQLGLYGDHASLPPTRGRPKQTANKFIINDVTDVDGDGRFNLEDIAEQLKTNKNNEWAPLEGDGDFRSDECMELLHHADIVVTNPPFSLFREYLGQLVERNKKFLIIGNLNAITFKEIFPLIQDDRLWLGVTRAGTGSMWFQVTKDAPNKTGQRVVEGIRYQTVGSSAWFTNLDHGRRHQPLKLMTMEDNLKFNSKMKAKEAYEKYVNFDAIEVPAVEAIPSDYEGMMGVPITFLGKYSPDQFEILGSSRTLGRPISTIAPKGTYMQGGPRFYLDVDNGDYEYTRLYDRLVIRHRKAD